jgi:hypothetical protein
MGAERPHLGAARLVFLAFARAFEPVAVLLDEGPRLALVPA